MRERIAVRNARARKGLGIETIEYVRHDSSLLVVWRVTLSGGKSFEVKTPSLGTESTVIRLAAQKLKDQPVRYA
jgi:hypothetical protein